MVLLNPGPANTTPTVRQTRAGRSSPRLCDLLARAVAPERSIRVVYGRGGWVNVNDLADLLDASEL